MFNEVMTKKSVGTRNEDFHQTTALIILSERFLLSWLLSIIEFNCTGIIVKWHIQVLHHKTPAISRFFYQFASRLTCTMACIGINANENGIGSIMIFLQTGRKLEGVGWYHAVIMIGRCYQGGRVMNAFSQVMIRRIFIKE